MKLVTVYIYLHEWIHTNTYMHTCVCTHTYVHAYACTHSCICICMHTSVLVYAYTGDLKSKVFSVTSKKQNNTIG